MAAPRLIDDPHMRMNIDDIYTKLSSLQSAINSFSQGMVSQTEGKAGDIRVFVSADRKPHLAIRTEWGWAESGTGIFSLEKDTGKAIAYEPVANMSQGYTLTGGESRAQLVMDTTVTASKVATLDTTQTITGAKTFTGIVTIGEDSGSAEFRIGNQTPGNEYAKVVYAGSATRTFNIPTVAATSTFLTTGNLTDITSTGTLSSITTSGKITTYNNVATEGYGVPAIVDYVGLTNQSTSITATNCTNTNADGLYRVSVYLHQWQGDLDAGTVYCRISWREPWNSSYMSVAEDTATVDFNTNDRTNKTFVIRHDGSSYITYATTVSGIVGDDKYALWITVERLN